MAKKDTVRRAIVWQSLACPKCGLPDAATEPEDWEAISNGSMAKCNHCGCAFKIVFQVQDSRSLTTRAPDDGGKVEFSLRGLKEYFARKYTYKDPRRG